MELSMAKTPMTSKKQAPQPCLTPQQAQSIRAKLAKVIGK
jgi:hypothetical protein